MTALIATRPRSVFLAMTFAMTLLMVLAMPLANSAAAERVLVVSGPGGRLTVTQRGASTVLAYATGGRVQRIVLPVEEGIFAKALDGASLLGAVPGRVLILSTVYASRPNGGSGACGAGTETLVRVIALRPTLRQTFAERVESCWATIEAGRIEWSPSARTLLIERDVFGGTADGHVVRTYIVQADGGVSVQHVAD